MRPDRIELRNPDETVFQVLSIPIGVDPDVYAREFLALHYPKKTYRRTTDLPLETAKTESNPGEHPLNVSRQLQHSTVRLECKRADGSISAGTGFHYRFVLADNRFVPAIITNKHVVAGAIECALHLTIADHQGNSSGRHEHITIKPFEWIEHPDKDIDLVMIPISTLLDHLSSKKMAAFYIDLVQDIVPSEAVLQDLTPLEEIVMIGYPNGIWDDVNNLPIMRRGITATSCNLNYRGRPDFLIDAAVFPGSSGSPVFIFNQGGYGTAAGGLVLGGRLLFIGILYAVHLHTAAGEIKTVTVPTDTKSMAYSAIPNNLGICVQSARILDFQAVLEKLVANTPVA